jgi:hypothetical protein
MVTSLTVIERACPIWRIGFIDLKRVFLAGCLPSMFIAFAREAIETTEKSPPDAARDAVVIGGFFEKDQSFPWFRHRITP